MPSIFQDSSSDVSVLRRYDTRGTSNPGLTGKVAKMLTLA